MGTVWIAEDLHLGRRVALKFLPQDLARHHQQALKRFKLEARTASSLNHPNICTIYEIVEADGEYFIAMEPVEGERLDRYLSRHRPDLQELLDSGIQIADALDAARSKGVIHRDIKPEPMGLGLDWLGNRIAASNSRFQWMLMNADGSNVTALANDHPPHLQLSSCNDGKHGVYNTCTTPGAMESQNYRSVMRTAPTRRKLQTNQFWERVCAGPIPSRSFTRQKTRSGASPCSGARP